MELQINDKTVGLKVSMWLIDEDRISVMSKEKPESLIWRFVAILYLAHKNFCRYAKKEPVITEDEMDLYVDEQLSNETGRETLTNMVNGITEQINCLSNNGTANEGQKKMIALQIGEA